MQDFIEPAAMPCTYRALYSIQRNISVRFKIRSETPVGLEVKPEDDYFRTGTAVRRFSRSDERARRSSMNIPTSTKIGTHRARNI